MRLLPARHSTAAATGAAAFWSRRRCHHAAVVHVTAQLSGLPVAHQQRPAVTGACRRSQMALTEDAVQALHDACNAAGQAHLLEHWDTLSPEQQQQLAEEIRVRRTAQPQRRWSAGLSTTCTPTCSTSRPPHARTGRRLWLHATGAAGQPGSSGPGQRRRPHAR